MLLEEVMRRSFPWLPKEAWPNCANLNLYTEAWQSVGANLRISPVNFRMGPTLGKPGGRGGLKVEGPEHNFISISFHHHKSSGGKSFLNKQ